MAGIESLRNQEEFRNYVSSQVALQKFGQSMLPYYDSILQKVHQNAGQHVTVARQPGCTRPHACSIGYKGPRSLPGWCGACFAWKVQLETHHVKPGMIQWQKQDSSSWPNSPGDIAGIFLKDGKASATKRDLSSILGVLINCNLVSAAVVPHLVAIRDTRNRWAHPNVQTSHSLTTADKTSLFGEINTVINTPDIRNTIPNFNDLLQELNRLQKNGLYKHESEIQRFLKEVRQEQAQLNRMINLWGWWIVCAFVVACVGLLISLVPFNGPIFHWLKYITDIIDDGHDSSPQIVTETYKVEVGGVLSNMIQRTKSYLEQQRNGDLFDPNCIDDAVRFMKTHKMVLVTSADDVDHRNFLAPLAKQMNIKKTILLNHPEDFKYIQPGQVDFLIIEHFLGKYRYDAEIGARWCSYFDMLEALLAAKKVSDVVITCHENKLKSFQNQMHDNLPLRRIGRLGIGKSRVLKYKPEIQVKETVTVAHIGFASMVDTPFREYLYDAEIGTRWCSYFNMLEALLAEKKLSDVVITFMNIN